MSSNGCDHVSQAAIDNFAFPLNMLYSMLAFGKFSDKTKESFTKCCSRVFSER